MPFASEASYPLGITGVVGADLARSGLFKLVDAGGVVPRPVARRGRALRRLDRARRRRGGRRQHDAAGGRPGRGALLRCSTRSSSRSLRAFIYAVAPAQFRATAHQIADVIYEKLTGDVGVFSTRIAYIAKQGPRYELLVAEADGFNPQSIVSSNEPLLSPVWSPDGTRIAYVSLENKKPVVYVQSLGDGRAPGRRQLSRQQQRAGVVAGRPRLAVTLTKDGGSQLYLINADGSGVQRLMSSAGIDTEANFAPDGRSILFTSDRGGSPQIYRLTLGSGAVERMTYDGSYNVSPRSLPDGKGFVFVRRDGGRFNIAMQDFATRQVQVLTQGSLDESPSVAPNGKLIIYASEQGGRGILAAVSSDGRVKQRLTAAASDVREPAWGPLLK